MTEKTGSSTIKFEPTGVKLAGTKAAQILDARFWGLLGQHLDGVRFDHVCIEVPYKDENGAEKFERITMGHAKRADESAGIVSIETEKPATLTALIKAIEGFLQGGK